MGWAAASLLCGVRDGAEERPVAMEVDAAAKEAGAQVGEAKAVEEASAAVVEGVEGVAEVAGCPEGWAMVAGTAAVALAAGLLVAAARAEAATARAAPGGVEEAWSVQGWAAVAEVAWAAMQGAR